MPLEAGAHLGPYEVLGPLGAGGMGEVYRARDPRLGRDVAIKILPEQVASDPDRVRRFEREARSTGALNHPNILAVYDFGTEDGAHYVVSELLEGETLRRKLDQSAALPVRKLADFATQIARGLAAAHEKGIVHRDLKPENIFVTRDGHVKILDFGLAKHIGAALSGEEETRTSIEGVETEPGVVMGTAGYMSPEQVRGQATDHRSDIFSFGIVLYEMASGRHPFRRDSSIETMNAVLKEEPADLLETNPQLPSGFAHIAAHCLEKDPHDRFQSARDLAFDLEALGGASGISAARKVVAASQRRWPLIAAAAVLVIIAAGSFWLGRAITTPLLPVYRQLTFKTGTVHSARFAPDGATVLYSGAWEGNRVELFSTRLDSSESRPHEGTPSGVLAISRSGDAAVSLNCRSIGLFEWLGTLARVPLAGGAPREITEDVGEADWSPDGGTLAITRRAGARWRLESPPGKILHESLSWISHPRFSPRGDKIAFIQHIAGNDGEIMLIDLAGNKKVLSKGWGNTEGLAWKPGGNEIWFTAGRTGGTRWLHAVTPDGKLRDILPTAGPSTLQDIAADGRVLLTRDIERAAVHVLAPGQTRERDLSVLDWPLVAGLSDDGRLLLVHESGEGTGVTPTFFLRRTDGSPAVKLVSGSPRGKLSRDGRWAAIVDREDRLMIVPTRAGESREIRTDRLTRHWITDWSPDNKRFLFSGLGQDKKRLLYRCTLETGAVEPFSKEPIAGGLYTPDGKRVLCLNWPENAVHRFYSLDGRPEEVVSFLDASSFVVTISADGRHVYFYERSAGFGAKEVPAKVFRAEISTGRRELWRELVPGDPIGVRSISNIQITPDGKAYAYTAVRNLSELYVVSGLR